MQMNTFNHHLYPKIFFFILIIIFSCNVEEKKERDIQMEIKQGIKNVLKQKYSEEFEITDLYFEKGLNAYQFEAVPKKEKDISFHGTYNELNEDIKKQIHDSYPNKYLGYEATHYLKSLLGNNSENVALDVAVYSYQKHGFGEEVPVMDDFLQNRSEKSTISNFLYFFRVPTSADDEIIDTIRQIIKGLHLKYGNNYYLEIGFWPEGFLENKSFERLTFGFNSTSHEDADNLLNKIQYMDKVLQVKIVNNSINKMDNNMIFSWIQDFNTKGQNEMIYY